MHSYSEALSLIRTHANSLPDLESERVPLDQAVNRIASHPLVSAENLPSFANSAMDGFAVIAAQTSGASIDTPLTFTVLGGLAAGDVPIHSPSAPGCWEIMTGAPFPEGFDACVRLEDAQILRDADSSPIQIILDKAVRAKQNRREPGEDFQPGSTLVKKGQLIRPEEILCLASLGFTQVSVFRKIRVGLISTGKELRPLGATLAEGQIRNSNAPYLIAALQLRNIDVTHLATILDDTEHFRQVIQKARSENYDLLLTTGAISMGKYDFVGPVLNELGLQVHFKKVAIRPGKPLLFGNFPDGPSVIGLPGNPVASAVGLRFFVDPFLRALKRQKPEQPLRARLDQETKKAEGSYSFLRGSRLSDSAEFRVQIFVDQRASILNSLLQSQVWVALPEPGSSLPAGTLTDVYPFLPLQF